MKNLKYLLVGLVLIASTACDNYFFDNKLDHETVITEVRNFTYTLLDDDYTTIAKSKAAQEIAAKLDAEVGAESTEYADALKKVGDDKCFNDKAIAKTYMTFALRAKYPELDKGSLCAVTYKELEGEDAVEKTEIYLLAKEWIFSIYFQESFESSVGTFAVVDINLGSDPSKTSSLWQNKSACMVANGYGRGETESWLISSAITVPADAEKPVLVFDQKLQYDNGNFTTECELYISGEYAGDQTITESQWKLQTIPKAGTGFGSSGEIDLLDYKGKQIYIGFRYRSNASSAIAWSVKNVTIREAE